MTSADFLVAICLIENGQPVYIKQLPEWIVDDVGMGRKAVDIEARRREGYKRLIEALRGDVGD